MIATLQGFALLALGLAWMLALAFRTRDRRELRAQLMDVVAVATRRGLPLPQLLMRMADGYRNWRKRSLAAVARELDAGKSLSEALDTGLPRRTIPTHALATIRSVEGTAAFQPMLDRLAVGTGRVARVRDRVWLALAYPSLLGVLLLGVHILSNALTTIEAGELELAGAPAGTGIATHATIIAFWVALGTVLLSYIAGARSGLQRGLAYCADRLPLLGQLLRTVAAARLLRTASALTAVGIPLGEILRRAAPTAGHRKVGENALAAARLADTGAPPNEVWDQTGLPGYAVAHVVLATGATPAELSERVSAAADACGRRVDRGVERAMTVLQPAVVSLFGILVAMHFAEVIDHLQTIQALTTEAMPW